MFNINVLINYKILNNIFKKLNDLKKLKTNNLITGLFGSSCDNMLTQDLILRNKDRFLSKN